MNNKYSIKNKSLLSATGTLVTAMPKATAVAFDILIDSLDTVLDRAPVLLDKTIHSGIDALEVAFDATETVEIEMHLTYEDWCEEKGVKPFSSREEKIAALRAARAKKEGKENKIITTSK